MSSSLFLPALLGAVDDPQSGGITSFIGHVPWWVAGVLVAMIVAGVVIIWLRARSLKGRDR